MKWFGEHPEYEHLIPIVFTGGGALLLRLDAFCQVIQIDPALHLFFQLGLCLFFSAVSSDQPSADSLHLPSYRHPVFNLRLENSNIIINRLKFLLFFVK